MEINSLLIIHGLLLILGALILSLLISIIFVYVPEVIGVEVKDNVISNR